MIKHYFIIGCCLMLVWQSPKAQSVLAGNQSELKAALAKAQPGDSILLKAGIWQDVALAVTASGAPGKPLVIAAQEPGRVRLTGNSFIRFGGNYITVTGLYFTDGYTKERAIVEFKTDDQHLANDCRFTNCIIENYSKPDRFNTDSWIIFWGQRNRIDHCIIGDKLNGGTTLIVELNDERSQNNEHSIDSNYFKGHSPLGSNGGETIRVGVSRYSLTPSRTQIHHNYFEHCSGEVEIVSIKSGSNNISNNLFYECEGGLVLRHGSKNTIANNIFIGNNKPFTGGVRVINPGHTVVNNLFIDLAGERFHSGFSVLNGVPNSSINRYYQVKDATIGRNTFINCRSIIFGAGKDPERTAAPQNVRFTNNLVQTTGKVLYEDANKDGGVIFSDNSYTGTTPTAPAKGFTPEKVSWQEQRYRGYTYRLPVGRNGADLAQLSWIDEGTTSPTWYLPVDGTLPEPHTHTVAAVQSKDLPAIVANAGWGDIIELADTGRYEIEKPIVISKPLTIRAKEGLVAKPELVSIAGKSLQAFVIMEKGTGLRMENIQFNSEYKSYGGVQAGISTTTGPMNGVYSLRVKGCVFANFNESSYSCIKGTKSTYADSVIVEQCVFRNNAGNAIDYSAEKEDKGIYNVEHLVVRNCLFNKTLSGAINVYRGGNDESTTGPEVIIDHCTFNEVENRMQGCVVKLMGVQKAAITNCVFNKSGASGRSIWFEEMSWDRLLVDYCSFYQSGRVSSFYNNVMGKHIYHNSNPLFANPSRSDYRLVAATSLRSAAGKPIGVQ